MMKTESKRTESKRTDIKRTGMQITMHCNLKCKHCLGFFPYYSYEEKTTLSLEDARKVLDIYFQVVDTVEHFTVTGGEPLLNKEVAGILEEVYKYENQILGSVDFVTNGTMLIPDEVLQVFVEHKDKAKVVLSNYGDKLSLKIAENEERLKALGITYRISEFCGDNLYYDGWIDFSDHSLKWDTIEKRDENAQKCLHRVGKYFALRNGELHCCSRGKYRIDNQIIDKIPGEYVPLMDETISIEEKRKLLMEMYEMKSSSSCAHCVGFKNGVPRVMPAQQLED